MPWQQLKTFLALTDDQVAKLRSNQDEFSRWREPKQNRIYQVQQEIGQQTAASPLDPNALGLRYAEMEAIRREIAEQQAKLIQDNLTILTEAQKPKFQTLEEAVKLQPVIDEARSAYLMPSPCSISLTLLRGTAVGLWFDTRCFVPYVSPPDSVPYPPVSFRTYP